METVQQHEWRKISWYRKRCIHCDVTEYRAKPGNKPTYNVDPYGNSFDTTEEPPCITRYPEQDKQSTNI